MEWRSSGTGQQKKKKKEAGGALTRSNRRGEHKVEWHEMHEMGTVPERAWSERERKYGERIGAQRSALKSPLKRLPCRDKSWIHAHAARLQFDLEDGQTLGRFPLLNAECAGLRRTSYSVSAFRVLTNPTFFLSQLSSPAWALALPLGTICTFYMQIVTNYGLEYKFTSIIKEEHELLTRSSRARCGRRTRCCWIAQSWGTANVRTMMSERWASRSPLFSFRRPELGIASTANDGRMASDDQ